MKNEPPWHISSFVIASYNFAIAWKCLILSQIACHLRKAFIIFFHWKRTSEKELRSSKTYIYATLSKKCSLIGSRRFKHAEFYFDWRSSEAGQNYSEDDELKALLDQDPCQTQKTLL